MTTTRDERRLLLVRHAKSVPKGSAPDFERELADRGRREAPRAGLWLAESGFPIHFTRCSSAVRTRETWQLIVPKLREPPPVVYEDGLYNASCEALIAALRATDESVTNLLMVGHNPGIHELAAALCGKGGKNGKNGKSLRQHIRDGLPTAGVVVMALPGTWNELAPGAGRPIAFWTP